MPPSAGPAICAICPPDEASAVARGSHSRGTTAGINVDKVGASNARAELMMMMVA